MDGAKRHHIIPLPSLFRCLPPPFAAAARRRLDRSQRRNRRRRLRRQQQLSNEARDGGGGGSGGGSGGGGERSKRRRISGKGKVGQIHRDVCGGLIVCTRTHVVGINPKSFSAEYSAETNIWQVLPKTKKSLFSNFLFPNHFLPRK
jgi:hypothetical protein